MFGWFGFTEFTQHIGTVFGFWPRDLGTINPLIAYRNRTNLADVRFPSAKSHECASDGAIRRSHYR